MNEIEGKVLGKQISHPREYAPEILVAVPRYLNREQYGIEESDLPFVGVDVWHAYELGFLTQQGLPVTGILKLVYPSNSEFLVESKSLKLYLNSFNMGKYGENRAQAISSVLIIIKNDLSNLLKVDMEVFFHTSYCENKYDFSDYQLLESIPEADKVVFEIYKEDKTLLAGELSDEPDEIKVSSNLLRSNCKITHQPDWGSIFIHLKSNYKIDKISILKYLVSIRDENHFHEEICEMVYKRLLDAYSPFELMVSCLYTRRGGIDICPVRASKRELLPSSITDVNCLTAPAFRQ
ncbi:NADPH-dependent 7-cyano-7-deazaguanine reductase QueF [Plebeiibacterium sediminum]|uniref:NADPH-dependent 7-cyano-7-deazaguanine reductase QueF n=1 Tax=Plebeiibacterium sediminum TaxID=2992112 RepID=A0AAE3M8B0_9BACT|nr:NADPH-dependent 7-cyano-7-deazaguanine reductase QueF [Plebeiobacterium sediminum]MCW3788787.1 NADPH-dependent 7-cyano-7-deazaguanine reductase QueF [Plebeiobacterium sediminum]